MTKNLFRVIDERTGEEADIKQIALNEEWASRLVYCDMDGFAVSEGAELLLLDECGNMAWCPPGRFRVVWAHEEGKS